MCSRLASNARRCILVGDPRQLPATSHLTNSSLARLYERSMFERYSFAAPLEPQLVLPYIINPVNINSFESAGLPMFALLTQYRMHPQIRQFPSQHFYKNQLIGMTYRPSMFARVCMGGL
jgi:senataxin